MMPYDRCAAKEKIMFAAVSDETFWDSIARKYAADQIKDMGGYEKTLARTGQYLRTTDRVFEFGCGTGTTALNLAPLVERITGTDLSSQMITIAQDKAWVENCENITFEKATLDDRRWKDGSFDVVMGFNALHMLRDLPGSLAVIHNMLKPGGLFISKTPCLRDANILIQMFVPVARAIGKAPFVGMFSAVTLRDAVQTAGFEIVAQEKHGTKGADFRTFLVGRKL
jgi:predicted TPR repeat methyltransferase